MPVHKGNSTLKMLHIHRDAGKRREERKFCFDQRLAVSLERKTASDWPLGC